ncbi:MAG TPA: lytic murein transglycosylase B [Gammaproteobacteria bacterium]|jgi:membrane-bound lytic murein transglycosylase B
MKVGKLRFIVLATLGLAVLVSRTNAQDVAAAQAAFIDRMVASHGFDPEELASIFAGVEIDERILESMSRPAERVMPWHEYRTLFVTDERISSGVQFWSEHAEEILAAAELYGVAPEMLVSILGIETWFGQRMGRYRVLESLSTLAFAYPPRASFFSSELEAFLLLTREERLDPRMVLGSYAGAMGAGQFIPTSFRAYAVDANGDGQRDLWEDWEDVLGSIANYFKVHGWRRSEPVVDRATLSTDWSGPEPANSMNLDDTVASLSERGYVFPTALPESAPATALGLEGQGGTEYWVGYHNFRVITRYNRSVKYALAAKELADAILAAAQQAAVVTETTEDDV